MGVGYQLSDRAAHDYQLWYLPGLKTPLRGPRVRPRSGAYLSFIGAAQTFGRFCDRPFPRQVGAFLEADALNLGISGAGPDRFARFPELLAYVNDSAFVVVQVMSARSVDTPLLKTAANQGVLTFQSGRLAGRSMLAGQAYHQLRTVYGEQALQEQIERARESWLAAYDALLRAMEVPILLVWISTRPPPASGEIEGPGVLGDFPHLVTREMVDTLSRRVHGVVDATYARERPQLLVNRQTGIVEEIFDEASFSGRPYWSRSFNTYYPTPQAHDHAARRLIAHILGDASLASRLPV